MVKPPRGMQPESVHLKKAGRAPGRSFQDDSFRNYMARKIDLQRKQFGLIVPPPPEERKTPDEAVRLSSSKKPAVKFAPDVRDTTEDAVGTKKRKKKHGIGSVLKKLKRKHGRIKRQKNDHENTDSFIDDGFVECLSQPLKLGQDSMPFAPSTASSPPAEGSSRAQKRRLDLFLTGVVVLVNGYTDPDTDTLQRMLHRHGGDIERYETTRVTHIIAEHLSKAKATIYKSQRKPTPVCYPSWIVDSVKAKKLLPFGDYLIEEAFKGAQGRP